VPIRAAQPTCPYPESVRLAATSVTSEIQLPPDTHAIPQYLSKKVVNVALHTKNGRRCYIHYPASKQFPTPQITARSASPPRPGAPQPAPRPRTPRRAPALRAAPPHSAPRPRTPRRAPALRAPAPRAPRHATASPRWPRTPASRPVSRFRAALPVPRAAASAPVRSALRPPRARPSGGHGMCAILCPCVPSGCFLPSRADLPSLARLPLVSRGVFIAGAFRPAGPSRVTGPGPIQW
jgi:hypothetical protein